MSKIGINLSSTVEMVGINNCFGESGKPLELMHKYKIDRYAIVESVKKSLKRKI